MSAGTVTGPVTTRDTGDGGGPGRTTVADTVVEKIAARAAGEVAEVGGRSGLLGGSAAASGPRARARVDGTLVLVELRLSVRYPAPVGAVTERVRRQVTDRVAELTGLRVRQVDIDVDELYAPPVVSRRVS